MKYPFGILSKLPRGGAVAARVAHNHEVAGSSPAPATISILSLLNKQRFFITNLLLEVNWFESCLVILLMLATEGG